jgi:hypothetical protein
MATKGRLTQGASLRSIESRVLGRLEAFTAGDDITALTAWLSVDTGAHLMRPAIYDDAGNRVALGTEQSVSASGSPQEITFAISYTVPSSGNYVIALCSENVPGTGAIYYDAGSNTSYWDADASNSYPPAATWVGFVADVGADDASLYVTYTPTGGTTLAPAPATLTLNGRAPTTSAFQNVRIREVLVNGSGQAVASATDIGLRVWYSGICAGAPDVSLNGMTTDANGTTSWSIATGALAFNQAIFYVAQNSVSYSHYACGRLVPSYE